MSRRIKHAFRSAAPPTIAMLIIVGVIVATRWSQFDSPGAGIFAVCGLTLVVFLTYFVLALTGFEVSRTGAVKAPRIYAWSVVSAIVILVFGVLFYLLHSRH